MKTLSFILSAALVLTAGVASATTYTTPVIDGIITIAPD